MSLPDENKRALKATHQFMLDILGMKVDDLWLMSEEEFAAWRNEAYRCIKHYPFDYQIDKAFKEGSD